MSFVGSESASKVVFDLSRFKLFSKVRAPFLQSLRRYLSRVFLQEFFVCAFVHEQQVYIGKEIRSTNVYQILVQYEGGI